MYKPQFADDTYLVVPGDNAATASQEEIEHLQAWATTNNLRLNSDKTKEIVFSACRKRAPPTPPPPRPDIERVMSLRVLGVIVNDRLTAGDHVATLLSSCSRMMYAMRVLSAHGLPVTCLQDVLRAVVVSRIDCVVRRMFCRRRRTS